MTPSLLEISLASLAAGIRVYSSLEGAKSSAVMPSIKLHEKPAMRQRFADLPEELCVLLFDMVLELGRLDPKVLQVSAGARAPLGQGIPTLKCPWNATGLLHIKIQTQGAA